MTKKKAKSKTTKKTAKKRSSAKTKKEMNPAEVRKEIAEMVEAEATTMAQAVIDEGKKGQLATVKYLFEVAEIYPPSTDGSHATEDEDCFAKTLLDRLDIPDTPVGRDEEDEPVKAATPARRAAADEEPGEKESNKQEAEQEDSPPEDKTTGDASHEVSVRV